MASTNKDKIDSRYMRKNNIENEQEKNPTKANELEGWSQTGRKRGGCTTV